MAPRAPQLTYDEPDREIPDSVRVRVRSYRNKAIAQVDAHQELLSEWLRSYGHAHVSEVLLNSITVLKLEMNKLAWLAEREGEHARGLRETVRSDPPDPDRARTPVQPRPDPLGAPWDDDKTPVVGIHGRRKRP